MRKELILACVCLMCFIFLISANLHLVSADDNCDCEKDHSCCCDRDCWKSGNCYNCDSCWKYHYDCCDEHDCDYCDEHDWHDRCDNCWDDRCYDYDSCYYYEHHHYPWNSYYDEVMGNKNPDYQPLPDSSAKTETKTQQTETKTIEKIIYVPVQTSQPAQSQASISWLDADNIIVVFAVGLIIILLVIILIVSLTR